MSQKINTIFEDLTYDVIDGPVTNENRKKEEFDKCPYLLVPFGNVVLPALLDTGSQVTCIDDKTCKYLEKFVSVEKLPLSNVSLISAFGKKPSKVQKQVLISIKVDNHEIPTIFLVVPKLNHPIILGSDWLSDNSITINYMDNNVYLEADAFDRSSVGFGRAGVQKLLNINYIQVSSSNKMITKPNINVVAVKSHTDKHKNVKKSCQINSANSKIKKICKR